MERLITLKKVEAMTGFRRAFIYREIAAGNFPRPIKIGPKASRWVERHIQRWILDRISESRSGEAA